MLLAGKSLAGPGLKGPSPIPPRADPELDAVLPSMRSFASLRMTRLRYGAGPKRYMPYSDAWPWT